MVETINKLTRIERQLTQDLGREPTAKEIAKEYGNGITAQKVTEIKKLSIEPVSLEKPFGDEDDTHFGDFVEDKDIAAPDEFAEKEVLREVIDDVFREILAPREEKVVRMRFGILPTTLRTMVRLAEKCEDSSYNDLINAISDLNIHYDTPIETVQRHRNSIIQNHLQKYSSPKTLEEVGKELNVKMSFLTPRLFEIAKLITEGETVADIGTDHAYLPIYIAKEEQIDTVIIAGMGSNTILDILKKDNNNILGFIIASQTNVEPIRKHPLIFTDFENELKLEYKKKIIDTLVEKEIQVFSIHTNYDASEHQYILPMLSLEFNIKKMTPYGEKASVKHVQLFNEIQIGTLFEKLKFLFDCSTSKISSNIDLNEYVNSFYISTGAGSAYMLDNQLTDCVYVTGEAKWHEFIYATESNVKFITLGHYMENYFISDIKYKLQNNFGELFNIIAYDIQNKQVDF
ncbi:hypothetical protein FQR65_LT16627 [Abscondita terminalis]|nr:hypothetical protein FQR65_LT16627 [Abscondita terminalis]